MTDVPSFTHSVFNISDWFDSSLTEHTMTGSQLLDEVEMVPNTGCYCVVQSSIINNGQTFTNSQYPSS